MDEPALFFPLRRPATRYRGASCSGMDWPDCCGFGQLRVCQGDASAQQASSKSDLTAFAGILDFSALGCISNGARARSHQKTHQHPYIGRFLVCCWPPRGGG